MVAAKVATDPAWLPSCAGACRVVHQLFLEYEHVFVVGTWAGYYCSLWHCSNTTGPHHKQTCIRCFCLVVVGNNVLAWPHHVKHANVSLVLCACSTSCEPWYCNTSFVTSQNSVKYSRIICAAVLVMRHTFTGALIGIWWAVRNRGLKSFEHEIRWTQMTGQVSCSVSAKCSAAFAHTLRSHKMCSPTRYLAWLVHRCSLVVLTTRDILSINTILN